jgi:hypothetical protein
MVIHYLAANATDRLFVVGNAQIQIMIIMLILQKEVMPTILKNGLTRLLSSTTNAMDYSSDGKAVVTKEFFNK